jgi:hypothetical protein
LEIVPPRCRAGASLPISLKLHLERVRRFLAQRELPVRSDSWTTSNWLDDDDPLVDPLEFLARVLVHIPEPYRHLVRFCGVYANRVRQTYRKWN